MSGVVVGTVMLGEGLFLSLSCSVQVQCALIGVHNAKWMATAINNNATVRHVHIMTPNMNNRGSYRLTRDLERSGAGSVLLKMDTLFTNVNPR